MRDEREGRDGRQKSKARELKQSPWWKQQIGPGICFYCRRKVGKNYLTLDHKMPLAQGGKTTKANCVPACLDCNRSKKHLHVDDWLYGGPAAEGGAASPNDNPQANAPGVPADEADPPDLADDPRAEDGGASRRERR